MFSYFCHVNRVIDGDTVILDLDLGFRISHTMPCRLLNVNAPEIRGASKAAGLAATEKLKAIIGECGVRFTARTHKDSKDKYGRYLVELFGESGGEQIDVNQAMRDFGFTAAHAVVA